MIKFIDDVPATMAVGEKRATALRKLARNGIEYVIESDLKGDENFKEVWEGARTSDERMVVIGEFQRILSMLQVQKFEEMQGVTLTPEEAAYVRSILTDSDLDVDHPRYKDVLKKLEPHVRRER